MNEDIVLLDFCGTVANFQTFDPFVLYVLRNTKPNKYKILNNKYFQIGCYYLQKIQSLICSHFFIYKTILIKQLNGLDKNILSSLAQDYYYQKVKPNLVEPTLNIIKKYKSDGFRVVIISGGCDLYIKYFAEEFGIKDVIATQLDFEKDVCLGKIKGLDCMGSNKKILLLDYLKRMGLNKNNLIACLTDSKGDSSILNLCQKKIIISKYKHQNWVTPDMEEIIWD